MTKFLMFVAILGTSALSTGCMEGMYGNHDGPAVAEARKQAATLADERKAADIVDSTVSESVSCYQAAKRAFNPRTGKSQVWVNRRPDDILECFSSEGFNRLTGKPLEEIRPQDVEDIFRDPRYRPAPPPPRLMTPAAPATYLPVQCPGCDRNWQPETTLTEPSR